ncbi:hypothetical protein [Caproiciproducens faecalis]|uniref:Uncharacterized protein n=1 Tax=Caproiciproducens faecalis TaxID=2820301 RepID=A0ABS7DNQ5_9FIRM|nr:hypothetical protein [Caproiciproducens faecalis]MBW7572721.1 hypothetical protein [Caproiciproducens faecalis]
MKEGYVLKSKGKPDGDALRKINRYTRREFTAEEIYTFSVVLCDNEIDRDGERFTEEALQKLAVLFVGKTGIFNHSMQTQNQTARIYDCAVERDGERTTQTEEPYCRLVAQAYLPKSDKNSDLILELDSGIKKEVSVGCAVGKVTCSICGADLKQGGCTHVKGKTYGGKTCCAVLSEPTDAYEWSFVAVPAQREAGVIKNFSTKDAENVEKMLSSADGELTLSAEQAHRILKRLETLEALAECGRMYRGELENSFVKYAGIAQPEIPAKTAARVAAEMDAEDLKCFEKAYRRRAQEVLPLSPQLAPAHRTESSAFNAEYKI